MRPVHAPAVGGNQTSNFISESEVGLAVPWTRQNGTVTATPPIVAGGVMYSAAVIVDESEVTDIRLPQSTAWAAPHMPSAPPIHSALVRSTVHALCLNLVFVFIEMSPNRAYARGFVSPAPIFIAGPWAVGRAAILVSFTGKGQ